jgi:hypothetical protein
MIVEAGSTVCIDSGKGYITIFEVAKVVHEPSKMSRWAHPLPGSEVILPYLMTAQTVGKMGAAVIVTTYLEPRYECMTEGNRVEVVEVNELSPLDEEMDRAYRKCIVI